LKRFKLVIAGLKKKGKTIMFIDEAHMISGAGAGGQGQSNDLANMLKPMALKARDLDPTRMILDESGGWAEGANLFLPFEKTPTKFNDIHNYPGPNINKNKFDGFFDNW